MDLPKGNPPLLLVSLLLTITSLCKEYRQGEAKYYCFGEVAGGILTVRFTYRAAVIRMIGAGYWRKGKAIYERENG